MSIETLALEPISLTRKIQPLSDYITARHAAQILSAKLGRPIRPGYIHKLKNVRFVKLDNTTKLYHKDDILACTVKAKRIMEP